jgi:hypothetical protein
MWFLQIGERYEIVYVRLRMRGEYIKEAPRKLSSISRVSKWCKTGALQNGPRMNALLIIMMTSRFIVFFAGFAVLCVFASRTLSAVKNSRRKGAKDRKVRKELLGFNVLVPMPHFSNPYARSENKQTTFLFDLPVH